MDIHITIDQWTWGYITGVGTTLVISLVLSFLSGVRDAWIESRKLDGHLD